MTDWGMDKDFYLLGGDAEEPLGLDDFKPFVHHRGGVDGYLCSHAPVGVAERLFAGDSLHLCRSVGAEWSARGGQDEFLNGVTNLAREALEDGGVFGVNGKNGGTVTVSKLVDEFSCDDEGLLIGESDGLACFDGTDGGEEPCVTDHGGEDNLDGSCLNGLADGVATSIDLDGEVGEGTLQQLVFRFIGNDDSIGEEAAGLLDEQLDIAPCREEIRLIEVGVFGNDRKGLRPDGASGTEYRYLFLFIHIKRGCISLG